LELHAVEIGGLPQVTTGTHTHQFVCHAHFLNISFALAASLFRKLCYENKNALMAGIICAGWDPINGGQVFSIPLGGSLVSECV
jgi:20S proteasome alpha/beta subunit